MSPARHFWVLAHRWAGLTIAFLLIICGVSGALLPFHHQLDRLIAPQFFTASTGPTLSPLDLRARAEAISGASVNHLPMAYTPGDAVIFSVEAPPGAPPLGYDELALDPVTGGETGRRTWGDLSDGRVNIMAFVYRLHYSLALDSWGSWILGIAALIWTLDCFVGFYLTLPARRRFGWLARWRRAWGVRTSSPAKTEYDLHRASGLWLWPILFLFAWSSVGFNLGQVYSPVMNALLGKANSGFIEQPELPRPRTEPRLDWPAALAQARALTADAAATKGFVVTQETFMRYDPASGTYTYAFRSDRDVYEKFAGARLAFDGNSGQLRYLSLPTGEHPRATVDTWLFGLHMAAIGGMPVRIAVSVIGLLVTALSVTGVLIWMRRRRARILMAPRHSSASPEAPTPPKARVPA